MSDSPRGPFVQYTNAPGDEVYDESTRTLTEADPFVAAEDIYEYLYERKSEYWQNVTGGSDGKAAEARAAKGQVTKSEAEAITIIDVHPYLDPISGKKYLYAAVYADGGNYIIGMETGENWTDEPKWETLTRLTRTNYFTPSDLSKENESDLTRTGSTTLPCRSTTI